MSPIDLALLLPDWNSLDSVRKAHSFLELWSIWLFAALVVCDLVAHLIEDNHKSKAKFIERFGLLCFALAVAAELGAYKYGQRNDDLSAGVISSLDTKSKEAFNMASGAHDLAKSASDIAKLAKNTADEAQTKVGGVGKEADALTVRMEAASNQLRDLEHKIRIQGPRGPLLEAGKAKFIETLKPFAGQRATVLECGGYVKQTPESLELEQDLLTFLGPQGAGWAGPGYANWSECNNALFLFGGNLVIFNPDGERKAETSAEALAEALHAIDITTSAIMESPHQVAASNLLFQGNDSPGALLTKDPNIVVILVAPNTMSDKIEWNKRNK